MKAMIGPRVGALTGVASLDEGYARLSCERVDIVLVDGGALKLAAGALAAGIATACAHAGQVKWLTLLSAADAAEGASVLAAGADAVLVKPFVEGQVVGTLTALLADRPEATPELMVA